MKTQTPAIIAGRMIGVIRLNTLIKAVELEEGDSALRTLKRELRCKGSRDGVLAFAREVLATVKDW
jgi:hypothetical protein